MMDIEKLVELLQNNRHPNGLKAQAASALSTLQAENEKLREKIEDARLEGYAKGLSEMSEENEKLRAENNMLRRMQPAELNGESARSLSLALEASQLREELERVKRERDAAVALVHEWEQYGRYLSPMGFTVPPNWRED